MTIGALSLIRECFGMAEYPLPDESIQVDLRGEVISHVGLFWRTITLAGHGPLEVGGVGLVCTRAGWRRLGLASACLEVARRRSALHGRPHLALFAGANEQSLYRGLGYTGTNIDTLLTFPAVGDVTDTRGKW